MSLATPTTQGLADGIVAQVESKISQTVPLLPKAFTRVLAKALAGALLLVYKYAGFIFLQHWIAHASYQSTVINGKTVRPLVEWGRQVGAGDPLEATRAELDITVTVLSQIGQIDAGTQVLFPATGVLYLVTTARVLDAPTVTVRIRAASDQAGGGGVGTIGNLSPGDVVTFASPPASIAREATVTAQAVTASDGESESAYRARVQERARQKPQGGAYADYRIWARRVAGVAAVYPYRGTTPGEVDVYVEATVASSGSADGIPTLAQREAVAAAIELDDAGLASNRPVGAAVNVLPITRAAFDVTVTGLDAADLAAAEEAIELALQEYLRTREPFIVGLSVLPRLDRVTAGALAGVVDAAASAAGGTLGAVTVERGGSPVTAYTLGRGEKAKLGTLTFE
jgi:uncharacterized phage protein gp47/JayE